MRHLKFRVALHSTPTGLRHKFCFPSYLRSHEEQKGTHERVRAGVDEAGCSGLHYSILFTIAAN
jgi:hypothetical protein